MNCTFSLFTSHLLSPTITPLLYAEKIDGRGGGGEFVVSNVLSRLFFANMRDE